LTDLVESFVVGDTHAYFEIEIEMVFIEAGEVQPMAALPPNPCQNKSMVTILQ